MNKHLHKLVFGFAIAVSALAGSAVAQEELKVPAAVGRRDRRMIVPPIFGWTYQAVWSPGEVQRIRRLNIERR